ncbi:MAG: hypothetical protein ABIH23_00705 [bacterium]
MSRSVVLLVAIAVAVLFAILVARTPEPVKGEEFLFDAGQPGSPVAPGWTALRPDTVYDIKRGYGWEQPVEDAVDVIVDVTKEFQAWHPLFVVEPGEPMLRDAVVDDKPITFRLDVPEGTYSVVVTVGRCDEARHDMAVTVNGQLADDAIDAYGTVWGSQGGTPTRTVKTVVDAADSIRIDFTYKPLTPDSWQKFSDFEPEGGRYWFIAKNGNAVAGIRIRRLEPSPVRMENGKLVCSEPGLSGAVDAYNSGDLGRAEQETDTANADPFARACLYEWIAGSMLLDDRCCELISAPLATLPSGNMSMDGRQWEQELLSKAISLLKSVPQTPTVKEHLDMDRRYKAAAQYVGMLNYESAKKETGLNCYERYWAAYDWCSPFVEGDPLYWKSLFMRGRIAFWNGLEGNWKHCFTIAKRHFAELKEKFPENRLVRIYTGDKIPSEKDYSVDETDAPRWAVLEREALHRITDVIHYWVENRQHENGELGGSWGDDVEILRTWIPAVLAANDEVACQAALRIGNGVWNSDVVEKGYSKEIGDVEHAAEPVSDTQPLLMALEFGNPTYFERCLETAYDMANVWTAVNPFGHRHFRAHFFSATEVSTKEPQTADVALNGRAAKPVIWVAWYSGLPAARKLLEEWCMAWVEDARRTDEDKPKWVVPGSVRFEDDRIGGFSDNWWDAKDYCSKFQVIGYTSLLYHNMLAACALSGNPVYLEPLLAALDLASQAAERPNLPITTGTYEWVGSLHNHPLFIDVMEKWRFLSGDTHFDSYLTSKGSGYLRYRLTKDISRLEEELQKTIDSVKYNTEMVTSEVLFTDRVSIRGTTALFSAMTGSVGNPTYYPFHAVTWENLDNKVAVLVDDNGQTYLNFQAYNFSDKPRTITAHVWSLVPGTYTMTQRSKERESGEITLKTTTQQVKVKEIGSSIEVTLGPNCLNGITLTLKEAGDNPRELLADLAICESDVSIEPNRKEIRVTVHNIGAVPAEKIDVRVCTEEKIVALGTIDWLDAPSDLTPKTKTLIFQCEEPLPEEPLTVEVDAASLIREHIRSNNTVTIRPGAE